MRNSFEDMKRLLADTEDVVITEVQSNTEKSVQKVLNGPRPQPPSAARSLRQGSQDDMYEDLPSKKKNVFRRALKGLSMKSSNDLGRIEEMLVQLLGEVEGLKVAQGLRIEHGIPEESYDDLDEEDGYDNDRGYEGDTGTSIASHATQSGHLSLPRASGGPKGFDQRKFSDHRISTVDEGDEEELDQHEIKREDQAADNQFENTTLFEPTDHLQTPTRSVPRGGSVPLDTPPQQAMPLASLSNENTPKTDKSKHQKHKSSSSSGWIPKVSRWSETTASTVFKGFRSSGRKEKGNGEQEEYATPPSRSGSDLAGFADADRDPYGEDKLHSGFSQDGIEGPEEYDEHDPVLSFLPVANEVAEVDPKYKAHRNSLNLQHPQPRPGPTHRYQTHLESQAQNYNTPLSPSSLNWGSQTSLNRVPVPASANQNRHSTGSNVSEGQYSNLSASAQAPARPPKEPITTSTAAPERPPKIRSGNGKLQKPSPLAQEHDRMSMSRQDEPPHSRDLEAISPGVGSSPRLAQAQAVRVGSGLGMPMRKPTGPRSMSSSSSAAGKGSMGMTKSERESPKGLMGFVGGDGGGLGSASGARNVNRGMFFLIAVR